MFDYNDGMDSARPLDDPGFRDLSGLDADATLTLAEAVLLSRRKVEVEDLRLVGHWAAINSADPRRTSDGRRAWSYDRLVEVGGEGSPRVREFCIAELAMVRQVHPLRCQSAIADVLDLEHRLPLTWERVVNLEAEAWVARKVASMTRSVPLATIDLVDRAVAAIIATEAPSRVLTLTQAKIIEADPAAHAAKAEAERRRRYVALSQTDEHGLRHVIARVTAGDAVWVDAMVERVADLITSDHPEGTSRDELRSLAFGWLARPAELLELLSGRPHERAVIERRRRKAVLYVHVSEAAILGLVPGVARVEDLGPMALSRLSELLGHADVTVKPVMDLADRVRLSSYEHPTDLKERVRLITGGDRFPYSGSEGLGADFDHPQPFQPNGPPGQTGTHNSAPLGRRHHRWKTHAGYTSRQCGDGRYVWRTPHGRYFLVDHRGTRPLDPAHGALIAEAPPGVDVYVPDVRLDYSPSESSRRYGGSAPGRDTVTAAARVA